jgi:hypothetical protein
MEVNAQLVIDNLLEQNKQLTLQIALLQAALAGPDELEAAPEEP